MSYQIKKALRTFAQLVVAGGLTGLVQLVTGDLSANTAPLVLGVWAVLVAYLQNLLEVKSVVTTFLPTAPVVPVEVPSNVVPAAPVDTTPPTS